MWISVDNAHRVIGANPNDMAGNTGWIFTEAAVPAELLDDRDVPRYRYEGGAFIQRTQAEMDADYDAPEAAPTSAERIAELEEALELLLSGVTE